MASCAQSNPRADDRKLAVERGQTVSSFDAAPHASLSFSQQRACGGDPHPL